MKPKWVWLTFDSHLSKLPLESLRFFPMDVSLLCLMQQKRIFLYIFICFVRQVLPHIDCTTSNVCQVHLCDHVNRLFNISFRIAGVGVNKLVSNFEAIQQIHPVLSLKVYHQVHSLLDDPNYVSSVDEEINEIYFY